ncbi:uncharacterized protein EV422DRAFT_158540 [Fimicolochytrium jonesii]|uniref:uncharacterized protein n=1 Tax=Fimicolochytrium jonesii TaxID=1396493 RepID=UPI0022FE1BF5|nr:uncharacterized protein EV422DRAFT_158540 [Fimicolochytrium jonesii]KAI8826222.1 hypothetical protein EV422DRAFT_158540 [Fimicolochytrium jonesii]
MLGMMCPCRVVPGLLATYCSRCQGTLIISQLTQASCLADDGCKKRAMVVNVGEANSSSFPFGGDAFRHLLCAQPIRVTSSISNYAHVNCLTASHRDLSVRWKTFDSFAFRFPLVFSPPCR